MAMAKSESVPQVSSPWPVLGKAWGTPLRITLVALALLMPAAVLFAGYVGGEVNRILTEQTIDSLRSELRQLRSEFDRGGIQALSEAVMARSDPAGLALYHLDSPGVSSIGNLKDPYAQVGEQGLVFKLPNVANGGTIESAAGIAVPVPGGGRLLVARKIEEQRSFAERLRILTFAGVAGLAAIALTIGWWASRRDLRRIAGVTATSRSIMAGDLAQRIPRDLSGDELDLLSANLNAMLARIEELMQALREVSDNIAHDLKTPLTRLRNRAEAALRDDGAKAHREGLERVIEEADGLIQTFNALLLIARLEAGAVDATRVDCDVAALVDDVAELYQPVADDAGLAITIEPHTTAPLAVNRQLVGQAVANMLDNAVKYSAAATGVDAGSITVSVMLMADRSVEVTVADRGPGIPLADRDRATKRFVRLEQSRSRPGTGLGLSLVAAVARLHGGTVRLEDNAPGLRIVLVLKPLERSARTPTLSGAEARVTEPAGTAG